jgi:hypothetical protein
MSETTVTFDNGRVYTREGDRYVWRTSPDSIGDIIAERDMVWAFDKLAASQAALAAARREVETVTRERDEARQALATVGIEQVEGEWCYTSDDGEQPADSLADALQRTLALIDRDLHADLATSRAAQEDVRRVEAWMEDYPDGRYVDVSRGWFCMVDVRRGDDEDVPAESIAALGRALAQEAGDATR